MKDLAAYLALTAEEHDLLGAAALGGPMRTRTWLLAMLAQLGAKNAQGKRYTAEDVRQLTLQLAASGWLIEDHLRPGYWQVAADAFSTVYLHWLDTHDAAELRTHLAAAMGYREHAYYGFADLFSAVAIVRLEIYTGVPFEEVERLKAACHFGQSWDDVLRRAVTDLLDEALFNRLPAPLQRDLLFEGHSLLLMDLDAPTIPLFPLTERYLAQHRGDTGFALRAVTCEHLLWAGRAAEIDAVLKPMRKGPKTDAYWQAIAQAIDAARLMQQGQWAEAEAGFDSALTPLKEHSGKRKKLLPLTLVTAYVLSLLAQPSADHLKKALKFCLAEGGKRTPDDNHWSGIVARAIQMRIGDEARDLKAFKPKTHAPSIDPFDAWRWLMAAWLQRGDETGPLSAAQQAPLNALRERVAARGLTAWLGQIDNAARVLQGEAPPADFFVPPAEASWRSALASLLAIAPSQGSSSTETHGDTRLVWMLDVTRNGALVDIEPHEQKRGPRGWGKAKPVSLARLAKAEKLQPADALVARAVRPMPAERTVRLDLAAAIAALVGHPHVEFSDAPGITVALSEAGPEIDVVAVGTQRRVRMLPTLHAPRPQMHRYPAIGAAEQKELEALQAVSILRDSPQRARLIRLSAAHRRVAQLLGDGLLVPADGSAQLQDVLQGLGAHFQIHADEVQAAREVEPDARLRAELAPQRDGVSLRLVVAPLGVDGPRLPPGSGRARLVSAIGGETVGAQRDLAQERANLDAVLDACPMLETGQAATSSEWQIDSADHALELVERLHALTAPGGAVAELDWPAGKALRVDTATLGQLQVNVRTATDWLALQGGVKIDEHLVFSLSQLIEWSRKGGGRFVPLGEGRYLALTQELRARLDEMATVVEVQRGEAQLPGVAANWLSAVTDGAQLDADPAFHRRIEQLLAAQDKAITLPPGLQAELRPYQEEGYRWAMRLAHAGLGACLADDMGLGKTLQSLAVLLARSAGGPALLIAPTSLMGNWQAEARRFAPTLQFHVFADVERAGSFDHLGPHDVMMVSYQLHQQNVAAFAAREWHTLVLDEAQAIKNAAAKRSQAVHDMRADFRLALSGTPIENRLSELWSVMRVCNPGLLGSLARFNERFAGPIERDRNRQAQRSLRRLISPFILRRTKAQVLDDLPPRTELTLTVQADGAERAHYEALRREALEAAQQSLAGSPAGQAQMNILAQLTKLRRAACDPRLVSPQLGLTGAKVQAFGELAAELSANGHKALVFSQFVDFLALLREPLDAAGIRYQYLDGATPTAERTRRVAAFQAGEGDLFLISLKAGGFGLNLTMADYVVIADPWWNPAAEDQASGRAHRIGQQRPVTVYRLVNGGTLEERIVALHQSKRELADSVLEGGDIGGVLKADELVALMQGD